MLRSLFETSKFDVVVLTKHIRRYNVKLAKGEGGLTPKIRYSREHVFGESSIEVHIFNIYSEMYYIM